MHLTLLQTSNRAIQCKKMETNGYFNLGVLSKMKNAKVNLKYRALPEASTRFYAFITMHPGSAQFLTAT